MIAGAAGCLEAIKALNRQMLAWFAIPPHTLGPPPLTCPVCRTTRSTCLARFGRDRYHEEQTLKTLDDASATVRLP